MRLTRVAIRPGSNPAVWNWSSSTVIHTPGKDDNSILKAYGSISRLSWRRKVVEIVAAGMLTKEAKVTLLLHNGLFGSKKGGLAVEAPTIMVD